MLMRFMELRLYTGVMDGNHFLDYLRARPSRRSTGQDKCELVFCVRATRVNVTDRPPSTNRCVSVITTTAALRPRPQQSVQYENLQGHKNISTDLEKRGAGRRAHSQKDQFFLSMDKSEGNGIHRRSPLRADWYFER